MKINPASVYNIYKQNQAKGLENSAKTSAEDRTNTNKIDTVTISCAGAQQLELSKVVQNIATEVHETPDAKRLADLKAAVANNHYQIPTSVLADAMLGKLDRKA